MRPGNNPETGEAYRRLFLDEAGGLRPAARLVVEDLLGFACFFKDRGLPGDAQGLALLEGSRQAVRHILKMSGAGGPMLLRLLEGDNYE